jgi:hypothetical protein
MTEKPNPFDVAARERALNDSATCVSTIWVGYLIFAPPTIRRHRFLEDRCESVLYRPCAFRVTNHKLAIGERK